MFGCLILALDKILQLALHLQITGFSVGHCVWQIARVQHVPPMHHKPAFMNQVSLYQKKATHLLPLKRSASSLSVLGRGMLGNPSFC